MSYKRGTDLPYNFPGSATRNGYLPHDRILQLRYGGTSAQDLQPLTRAILAEGEVHSWFAVKRFRGEQRACNCVARTA